MVYIVMGVSGCGKTTIGKRLSQFVNLPFYDADDFHSFENIQKMTKGKALGDDDREVWLKKLANKIILWNQAGNVILGCSALKEKYREILNSQGKQAVRYIFLKGDFKLVKERLEERENHFFNMALLQSQFDTLETPKDAIVINIENSIDDICHYIMSFIEIRQN